MYLLREAFRRRFGTILPAPATVGAMADRRPVGDGPRRQCFWCGGALRVDPCESKSDAVVHFSTSGSIAMNNIIYIVGLVVVVLFIAGFLGLR